MKADLFVRGMPETTFKKMMKMKDEAGFGKRDFADFFTFLTREVRLSDSQAELIQKSTRESLLEVWVQNLGHNLPRIWDGKSIADIVPQAVKDADARGEYADIVQGSAVVIGRGPSVYKHRHLEALAASRWRGVVVCTDGALIDALKAGVRPEEFEGFYVVTVDGNREKIVKWYDDPLVDEHGKSIKAVLCTSCAPNVAERCAKAGVEVYWFHPLFDDWRNIESFTKIQALLTKNERHPNGVPSMQAAGHAGGCAWVLAWVVLRRSPVALIGLDLGYLPETPKEETYYWKGLEEQSGGNQVLMQLAFKTVHNPDFGVDAVVDPVFEHYRMSMMDLVSSTPPWVQTWNCSEGGSLFGEGIKCVKFSEFLEKFKR